MDSIKQWLQSSDLIVVDRDCRIGYNCLKAWIYCELLRREHKVAVQFRSLMKYDL